VRTKSTYTAMLGLPNAETNSPEAAKEEKKKPKVGDVLRGLLGR
jgi:hypothetical protein